MLEMPELEVHPMKTLLREQGISQVKVAKALNISLSSLTAYLNGYRQPPQRIRKKLDELKQQLGED